MYRYTANPLILRALHSVRNAPYVLNKEYRVIEKILEEHMGGHTYTHHSTIARWFEEVSHFSKTQLKEIPVNGYLFPVSMFKEEVL